jgi:hypothetical protein
MFERFKQWLDDIIFKIKNRKKLKSMCKNDPFIY